MYNRFICGRVLGGRAGPIMPHLSARRTTVRCPSLVLNPAPLQLAGLHTVVPDVCTVPGTRLRSESCQSKTQCILSFSNSTAVATNVNMFCPAAGEVAVESSQPPVFESVVTTYVAEQFPFLLFREDKLDLLNQGVACGLYPSLAFFVTQHQPDSR